MNSVVNSAAAPRSIARGRAVGLSGLITAIISGLIAIVSFVENTQNQQFLLDLTGNLAGVIPGIERGSASATELGEMITVVGAALALVQTNQTEQLYRSLVVQRQVVGTMIEQLEAIAPQIEDPTLISTDLQTARNALEEQICQVISSVKARADTMGRGGDGAITESRKARDDLLIMLGHFTALGVKCDER